MTTTRAPKNINPNSTSQNPIALAIHGGAGAKSGRDFSKADAHLLELANEGKTLLESGHNSLDVVELLTVKMEASGYYIAGKGSPPNQAGYVELDAAIMSHEILSGDKTHRKAGAIAAVAHLKSPIQAARTIMERTPHVMLAGSGAENFCKTHNLPFITNPDKYYVVPIGVFPEELDHSEMGDALGHGTVGAVALDKNGSISVATSTGGVFGKMEGRVGDTPLIGSGTWADGHVGASCTGLGEYFILAGGAQNVANRFAYRQNTLQEACADMIDTVDQLGGNGGVIAVSHQGDVAFCWNSQGMKRAGFGKNCPLFSATF